MPYAASSSTSEVCVPIDTDRDIVEARKRGRALADDAGFGLTDLAIIATAISELARNTLQYASGGQIVVRLAGDHDRRGIEIIAADDGPGIDDVPRALQDGYSTSGSLGLGLPGVRRLMDEFQIESQPGEGSVVTAKKWRR
jgi:serine/threonine-protein kinase RsbT